MVRYHHVRDRLRCIVGTIAYEVSVGGVEMDENDEAIGRYDLIKVGWSSRHTGDQPQKWLGRAYAKRHFDRTHYEAKVSRHAADAPGQLGLARTHVLTLLARQPYMASARFRKELMRAHLEAVAIFDAYRKGEHVGPAMLTDAQLSEVFAAAKTGVNLNKLRACVTSAVRELIRYRAVPLSSEQSPADRLRWLELLRDEERKEQRKGQPYAHPVDPFVEHEAEVTRMNEENV